MPKDAKRRFVGLTTEEVSLVDSPANEVEFLVVKNHQEKKHMPANAAVKVRKTRVPVEVEVDDEEGADAGVTKALEHVSGIVNKIAGLVSTKKEAKGPNEGEADEADEGEEADDTTEGDSVEDGEELVEKSLSIKAILSKCGMDGVAMKSAMIKLKAAGIDPSGSITQTKKEFPPPKGGKKPSGKKPMNDDDDDEEDDDDDKKKGHAKKTRKAAEDEPLTMAGLAKAVQKAAAFTPQRIAALQNAQDTLKLVLEAVTPGTSPDANTPAKHGTHDIDAEVPATGTGKKPVVRGTVKSDELVDTLKSLSGAVDKLVERVEAIETARSGSNSAESEGTTDSTVKKNGSIWRGLL